VSRPFSSDTALTGWLNAGIPAGGDESARMFGRYGNGRNRDGAAMIRRSLRRRLESRRIGRTRPACAGRAIGSALPNPHHQIRTR
jgi:hypothetical protein